MGQCVAAKEVTELLYDWHNGRTGAVDELVPLVYAELRRLASSQLGREHNCLTLQPTALIHEAYMRLVDQTLPQLNNRSHFFGLAGHLMRQILVDHARTRMAAKRGGGVRPVALEHAVVLDSSRFDNIVELDMVLEKLAAIDERKCKVLEMRYFAGLNLDEIAEAIGMSVPTVTRDLRMAEAFVLRELNPQK